MKTNSPLYDGILASAKAEALDIVEKGKVEAAKIKENYEEKIRKAEKNEQALLEKRLKEIELAYQKAKNNMEKSQEDALVKEIRKHAQRAFYEEMATLVNTEEYKKAQVEWIAEGAIALDSDEVIITTSKNEEITDEMIKEAVNLVEKFVSRKVNIKKASNFLSSQGLVISSTDGKIAYNNSVNVRFMRKRTEFERVLEGSL